VLLIDASSSILIQWYPKGVIFILEKMCSSSSGHLFRGIIMGIAGGIFRWPDAVIEPSRRVLSGSAVW